MKRFLCIIAALAAGISALNAAAKIDRAPEYGDNVQRVIILEAITMLGVADTVYVALPQGYDASKSYKTVYLLHGLDASPVTYLAHYGTAEEAARLGLIIVHLNAHKDMWYLNSTDPHGPQYRSYFFSMLMPAIGSQYAVDKAKTYLCGLSMGGHGAMTLFEEHPELFDGAVSVSGTLELIQTMSGRPSIGRMLGDYADGTNMEWHRNSAVHNIEKLRNTDGKLILVTCGTSDPLFDASMMFMKRCLQLGVNAEFRFGEGTHNSAYWHREVPLALEAISKR